jgi:hypothetical protein
MFHSNHGKRIELKSNGLTATRNINEFNHGIVLSKTPLIDDVKFEVRIDVKINSWSGSIEIGVSSSIINFSNEKIFNYRFFHPFVIFFVGNNIKSRKHRITSVC